MGERVPGMVLGDRLWGRALPAQPAPPFSPQWGQKEKLLFLYIFFTLFSLPAAPTSSTLWHAMLGGN